MIWIWIGGIGVAIIAVLIIGMALHLPAAMLFEWIAEKRANARRK